MNLVKPSSDKSNSFLFILLGFKRTKRLSHRLLIILLHLLGWCMLFFLPLFFYPVRINNDTFFLYLLADKTLLVGFFYLNYYLLIPRLFERKKYGSYILMALLLFLVYVAQLLFVRTLDFPGPGAPFQQMRIGTTDSTFRGTRPMMFNESTIAGIPRGVIAMTLNNGISSIALILAMGGFIRLAYSFIRNQHEKKELENVNLNAEINLLKAQINPHFLFNSLNSIYSLANTRSELTAQSVLKLADLLRYMLYDSGDNKVDLAKDIQHITNYIDLQKLRLSQKVTIYYEVMGDLNKKVIAPLLLITFIENAFKHGISYAQASEIRIKISVFSETLTMMVSNPVIESNRFADGGLGLKNTLRRLDLLYPDDYLLDISHTPQMYIVNLKIKLNRD